MYDRVSPLIDSFYVFYCRTHYMTSELLPSGPQALDGWQKIAPVARVWLSWMRWHCLRHIRIVLQV